MTLGFQHDFIVLLVTLLTERFMVMDGIRMWNEASAVFKPSLPMTYLWKKGKPGAGRVHCIGGLADPLTAICTMHEEARKPKDFVGMEKTELHYISEFGFDERGLEAGRKNRWVEFDVQMSS